jgi:hypothetical protein
VDVELQLRGGVIFGESAEIVDFCREDGRLIAPNGRLKAAF